MSKHSSDNVDPAEFAAQWARLIALKEEELRVAEAELAKRSIERTKAVDAVRETLARVKKLKSKLDSMQKSRRHGDKP